MVHRKTYLFLSRDRKWVLNSLNCYAVSLVSSRRLSYMKGEEGPLLMKYFRTSRLSIRTSSNLSVSPRARAGLSWSRMLNLANRRTWGIQPWPSCQQNVAVLMVRCPDLFLRWARVGSAVVTDEQRTGGAELSLSPFFCLQRFAQSESTIVSVANRTWTGARPMRRWARSSISEPGFCVLVSNPLVCWFWCFWQNTLKIESLDSNLTALVTQRFGSRDGDARALLGKYVCGWTIQTQNKFSIRSSVCRLTRRCQFWFSKSLTF